MSVGFNDFCVFVSDSTYCHLWCLTINKNLHGRQAKSGKSIKQSTFSYNVVGFFKYVHYVL